MSRKEYYKNIDRVFRLPRIWSNRELRKIAHFFEGDIVNVSGWKDIDKEGQLYKDYFINAKSYSISNYKAESKGMQGLENEFFLDLEENLSEKLTGRFDVVFNHTVLEHIYNVRKAMENICKMTKDIAIVVVPFLQEMHAEYGDYWRFTPLTMKKMFEENGMDMIYCNFNSHSNSSVYLFCIGTKNKEKWQETLPFLYTFVDPFKSNNSLQNWVGTHAIQNSSYYKNKHSLLKKIKFKIKFYLKKLTNNKF